MTCIDLTACRTICRLMNGHDLKISIMKSCRSHLDGDCVGLFAKDEDNDTTISTMSKHMDYMREAVVSYSQQITNLNNKLDTKDTIILDLKKAIKEQADALRNMSQLLADYRTEYSNLTRGTR